LKLISDVKLNDVIDIFFKPTIKQPLSSATQSDTACYGDIVATERSFDQTEFLNHNHHLQLLKQRLSQNASTWSLTTSEYYSPYIAIVNSSMTGKSRLCMELVKEGVFLFVTCFRKEPQPFYRPPRTEGIAKWATSEPESTMLFQVQCYKFFELCMSYLNEFLQKEEITKFPSQSDLATTWLKRQDNLFWETIHKELRNVNVNINDRIEAIAGYFAQTIDSIAASIKKKLGCMTDFNDTDIKVVFLFDEARYLKIKQDNESSTSENNFNLLRRGMRVLPKGDTLKTFCILTDTASSVANLASPKEFEDSGRVREGEKLLYPPFVWVMTLDAWWQKASEVSFGNNMMAKDGVLAELRKNLIGSPKTISSTTSSSNMYQITSLLSLTLLEDLEFNALFGRPAYYPNLNFRGTAESRHGMLLLMMGKLIRMSSFTVGMNLSDRQLIAMLSSTVSIEVSAASKLASELAAGNMRLVAGVSMDRHLVYTMEISEPVISLAAHNLFCVYNVSWTSVLNSLHNSLINSSTMVGFIGEIAAQILCVMAWQKSISTMTPSSTEAKLPLLISVPFIPALDYLSNLLGKSFVDRLCTAEMKQALDGAYVRVNQFVKTFVPVTKSMLREYFLRASAIYCKETQRGVDLVLPMIYLGDEKEEDRRNKIFDFQYLSSHLSSIMIQVKLWKTKVGDSYVEGCFTKLLAIHRTLLPVEETSSLPAVSIVVDVRRHKSTKPSSSTTSSTMSSSSSSASEDPQPPSKKRKIDLSKDDKGKVSDGDGDGDDDRCKVEWVPNDEQYPNILQLHVEGLSPLDIFPDVEDSSLYDSFQRILDSQVDPSISPALSEEDRVNVKKMFGTQPYNISW
jgi:hypothetical protein